MGFSDILRAHAARYPLMQPRDAVKLVYQSEFGGGHLVTNADAAKARLADEYAAAPKCGAPLFEDIGGGMVRVMLGAVSAERYPLDRLCCDFIRSAAQTGGTQEGFLKKLALLRALTAEGAMPFSSDALSAFLSTYDGGAVSHSATYRKAYAPAYRVLAARFSFGHFLQAVEALRAAQPRTIVAIDGRCGAGKTTLAAFLQKTLGASVIHLDDFFLRPEQRTNARLDTPGENIDHERFLSEVLLPLREGALPSYRRFDCHVQRLTQTVRVEPSDLFVVEGSYACHHALREHYDLRAFLDVEGAAQQRRIEQRDGAAALEIFLSKWIPMEEKYFEKHCVEAQCEYSFADCE
ncbi:MAG: hypothetical protein IJF15_06035 [Oscillospiraceae bacterium]|nr:hypothetical protein [Oscillospiraceae bacterium]